MSTRSISDYAGRGPLAARPVSAPVVSTGTAFYYSTDTSELFAWNGSGWVGAGAPPGPSVLQLATADVASAATGVTLPAPPTANNLLLGIWHDTGTLQTDPATGWQRIGAGGSIFNNINFYAKWALTGDTALQVPAIGTRSGNFFIYEIENARAPQITSLQGGSNTTAASAFDIDAYLGILPSSGLLFAATAREGSVANATSVTGYFTTLNEALGSATSNRTTQIIRGNVTALSNVDFTVNYAGSVKTGRGWTLVV